MNARLPPAYVAPGGHLETAKLHPIVDKDGARLGFLFECPGCRLAMEQGVEGMSPYHAVYTSPVGPGKPVWTFDGNMLEPTFSPSILTHVFGRDDPRKCHLFIRKGMVEFCSDSFHPAAGKTIRLPDWD